MKHVQEYSPVRCIYIRSTKRLLIVVMQELVLYVVSTKAPVYVSKYLENFKLVYVPFLLCVLVVLTG